MEAAGTLMITAEIYADTLEEFYAQLVAAQEHAHGVGYCSHHAVIHACAKECLSYAELGVNQGATLACAVLAGYGKVIGVDHRAEPIQPFLRLFGGRVDFRCQDSRIAIGEVDFLLIDSQHYPNHMRRELEAHGPNVNRYILAHDTHAVPTLHRELVLFGERAGWIVQARSSEIVGWTLMKKLRIQS